MKKAARNLALAGIAAAWLAPAGAQAQTNAPGSPRTMPPPAEDIQAEVIVSSSARGARSRRGPIMVNQAAASGARGSSAGTAEIVVSGPIASTGRVAGRGRGPIFLGPSATLQPEDERAEIHFAGPMRDPEPSIRLSPADNPIFGLAGALAQAVSAGDWDAPDQLMAEARAQQARLNASAGRRGGTGAPADPTMAGPMMADPASRSPQDNLVMAHLALQEALAKAFLQAAVIMPGGSASGGAVGSRRNIGSATVIIEPRGAAMEPPRTVEP